jgi:hypothetical protein
MVDRMSQRNTATILSPKSFQQLSPLVVRNSLSLLVLVLLITIGGAG